MSWSIQAEGEGVHQERKEPVHRHQAGKGTRPLDVLSERGVRGGVVGSELGN